MTYQRERGGSNSDDDEFEYSAPGRENYGSDDDMDAQEFREPSYSDQEPSYSDQEEEELLRARSKRKSKKSSSSKRSSGSRKVRRARVPSLDTGDLDDPEQYIHYYAWRLVSWRRPEQSLVALSILFSIYVLMVMHDIAFSTIVTFALIAQLSLAFLALHGRVALRNAGLISQKFDAKSFIEKLSAISSEDFTKICKGFAIVAGDLTDRWEDLLDEPDRVKVALLFGGLSATTLVGLYIDLHIALLGAAMAPFLIVPLYMDRQENIDEAIMEWWGKADAILN